MRTYLEANGQLDLGTPENVSSVLNHYIYTLGLGLSSRERTDGASGVTSCCPRVRMSNHLVSLVRRKLLSAADMALLLDHNYDSAIRFYGRVTEDSESEDEPSEDEY